MAAVFLFGLPSIALAKNGSASRTRTDDPLVTLISKFL